MDGFKELRPTRRRQRGACQVREQLLAPCIYDVARALFCLNLSGDFFVRWNPTPWTTRPSILPRFTRDSVKWSPTPCATRPSILPWFIRSMEPNADEGIVGYSSSLPHRHRDFCLYSREYTSLRRQGSRCSRNFLSQEALPKTKKNAIVASTRSLTRELGKDDLRQVIHLHTSPSIHRCSRLWCHISRERKPPECQHCRDPRHSH